MPSQTEAGKAFEYALLKQTFDYLSVIQNVEIVKDSSFLIAEKCFNLFSLSDQSYYLKAASVGVKHIIKLEPRLNNFISNEDILILQIVADREGIKGDVRDVLFIRSSQNWEIGISAKNNHKAVKHSRLSQTIDFGKDWLNLSCSESYFQTISPIFIELSQLKSEGKLWRDLKDKSLRFYLPILNAFKHELLRLDQSNPNIVPANLLKYLIGNKDFYKVIKGNKKTEIYGFHFYGSLNKSFKKIKPISKVSQLHLPSRIIELTFKKGSMNTLVLSFDEGWQISFRLHNASSRVEPSLKFDINLIGQPLPLYTQHLTW